MVRRSVADDSYGRGPFARSIELGEPETLPRAELDLTVAYWKRHAVADDDRFNVRGTIRSSEVSRSFCTSGSAFSFTKTAAVVCPTLTATSPSRIFARVTAAFT